MWGVYFVPRCNCTARYHLLHLPVPLLRITSFCGQWGIFLTIRLPNSLCVSIQAREDSCPRSIGARWCRRTCVDCRFFCGSWLNIAHDMIGKISARHLGILTIDGRVGRKDIGNCTENWKRCRRMRIVKYISAANGNVSMFNGRQIHLQWVP